MPEHAEIRRRNGAVIAAALGWSLWFCAIAALIGLTVRLVYLINRSAP